MKRLSWALVIPDIVEVCDVNGDYGFGLDDYDYGLDIDGSLIGDRNPKVPKQLSFCILNQTLCFEPPAMAILRQRVLPLAEAAPLSAESPLVDPLGPPQALSQSLEPPSLPLGDPPGTTPGPPSWAGSPPTRRPPTFSRITRFTNTRAREFTNTNQLVPSKELAGKCAPCHRRVIVCK